MARILRYALVGLILCVFLAGGLLLAVNPLLRIPAVKSTVFTALSRVIDGRVAAGVVRVDFQQGIILTLDDVSVNSAKSGILFRAKKVDARFLPQSLWDGHTLLPGRLRLIEPQVTIFRNFYDSRNSDNTLAQVVQGLNSCDVMVSEGSLDFAGTNTAFSGIFFKTIAGVDDRKIILSADLIHNNRQAPISGQGKLTGVKNGNGLFLELAADDFSLSWIPPVPGFSFSKGSADLRLRIQQTAKEGFHGQIEADLHDPEFTVRWTGENPDTLPDTRFLEKKYSFNELSLQLDTDYLNNLITLSSGSLTGQGFLLELNGSLDLTEKNDPALHLKIGSNKLTLSVFKQLFPDPLVADWLPRELFPRFTEGEARLKALSLDGRISEMSNIDRPENREVLNLEIELEHIQIRLQEDDIEFNNCSGRVVLKSGRLTVEDVNGRLGKSGVESGSFIIGDLYEDDTLSSFHIPGRFFFTDLVRLAGYHDLPTKFRHEITKIQSTGGSITGSVDVDYRPSWQWPRLAGMTLSGRGDGIRYPDMYQEVDFKEFKIDTTGKGRSILQGNGVYGDSPFSFSGYLLDNLTGSVNLESLLPLGALFSLISLPETWRKIESSELLPVRITVNRNVDNWRIEGTVRLPGIIRSPGFVLHPGENPGRLEFGMTMPPNQPVTLQYIRLLNSNSVVTATGSWNFVEKRLELKVKSPGFFLDSLELEKEGRPQRIQGRLAGNLQLVMDMNNLPETRVDGTLFVRNFGMKLSSLGTAMSNGNAALVFHGQKIDIVDGHLQLESNPGSPIEIEGVLKGWRQVTGNILVSGNQLDFTDMFNQWKKLRKDESSIGSVKQPARNPLVQIDVAAKIGTCRINTMEASPLRVTGRIHGDDFFLDRLFADMKEGMIGFSLGEPAKNGEREASLYFRLADISFDWLEGFIPGVEEKIRGSFSTEGLLTTRGRTKHEYRQNLRGPLNVEIKDGEILNDNVMLSIMEMLSIEKLVKQRPDHVRDDSFYFSSLKAVTQIEDGVMKIDNLLLDSFAFNGAVKGRIDLEKLTVDSTLAVSPFGTADFLVGKIPLVGYILTGREKSLVSYYFRIHGPLFDPEVEYTPLKNIPESLIGYVKRLLITPAQIFQDLTSSRRDFDENRVRFKEKIDREFARALSELPE